VLLGSDRSFGNDPPNAPSTAACASTPRDTRPLPGHAVLIITLRTVSASIAGLTARIIAATPATSGAAIDVPDCSDPVALASSGATGMLSPGAHTLIDEP
jgi:hypothetical protein